MVERWYDVDVIYETNPPEDMRFTLEDLRRDIFLSELLMGLNTNRAVKFEMDPAGKKVVVKNK
jgi:hypothetical protein